VGSGNVRLFVLLLLMPQPRSASHLCVLHALCASNCSNPSPSSSEMCCTYAVFAIILFESQPFRNLWRACCPRILWHQDAWAARPFCLIPGRSNCSLFSCACVWDKLLPAASPMYVVTVIVPPGGKPRTLRLSFHCIRHPTSLDIAAFVCISPLASVPCTICCF